MSEKLTEYSRPGAFSALWAYGDSWLNICFSDFLRGEFQVAEVTSRFPDVDAFIALVCDVGFELVTKASCHSAALMR